jgi:hypothetical protein
MARLTMRVTQGQRPLTVIVARHPGTIADVIKRFASARGVSPLSVDYSVH